MSNNKCYIIYIYIYFFVSQYHNLQQLSNFYANTLYKNVYILFVYSLIMLLCIIINKYTFERKYV